MDIKQTIELIITAFELAGIAVLAIGSLLAFIRGAYFLVRFRNGSAAYRHLRLYMGRSIVVALEILIAADIIRSIVVDPTLTNVAVLGLIVLIRTFLSWSLEVEIDGEWPWQRKGKPTGPDEL